MSPFLLIKITSLFAMTIDDNDLIKADKNHDRRRFKKRENESFPALTIIAARFENELKNFYCSGPSATSSVDTFTLN